MNTLISWLKTLWLNTGSRLLSTVILLVIGILIIRTVQTVITKAMEKSKLEKAAHSLIRSVVRVVLYGLLAMIVASSLGIDVTGIVALASVVTLAVSLALQNSLTNVIGGFTLLYTRPFSSGDYVEIAGQSGTVEEIGMAYTKLVTPDNKMISIPNSAVVAAQIINYTVTGKRRVAVDVTVAYTTDAQKVLSALMEVAQVDYAMEDPAPFACILGYVPEGIQYSVRIWTTAEDYWDAFFLMNRRLQEVFARDGLSIVYPVMHVQLDK